MKENRKMSKFMQGVMAVVLLTATLLTGCGDFVVPENTDLKTNAVSMDTKYSQIMESDDEPAFIGMYKADEEVPEIAIYQGDLVYEADRGTLKSGGSYVLPAVREDAKNAERLNQRLDELSAKHLGVADGADAYYIDWETSFLGYVDDGVIELCAMEEGRNIGGVYELYTGKYLTVEEFLRLTMNHWDDGEGVIESLKEVVVNEYTNQAMYDARLTRKGLEITLEKADWTYDDGIIFYDENGVAISHYGFWNSDFRDDYFWKDKTICYKNIRIAVPAVEQPGCTVVETQILETIAAFEAETKESLTLVEVRDWISGRYLVYGLKMSAGDVTRYEYFFVNLVTTEAENSEDVYAVLAMNRQLLDELIREAVDQDYKEAREQITHEPFSWNHDEAMYQRTLQQANVDGVRVIPGSSQVVICYDAYLTEDGKAVQRECYLPELHFGTVATEEELDMYPGLESWFEMRYGKQNQIGYANYGAWQLGDFMVIAVGMYDSNMEWAGYKTLCFDTVTGSEGNLYAALNAGHLSESDFEQMLKEHLESTMH